MFVNEFREETLIALMDMRDSIKSMIRTTDRALDELDQYGYVRAMWAEREILR